MKADPIDRLLDQDDDLPVPKEHERRIREGLGPLLVAAPLVAATVVGAATTSTAKKVVAKSALGKWVAAVAIASGGAGFVVGRASAPRVTEPTPAASVRAQEPPAAVSNPGPVHAPIANASSSPRELPSYAPSIATPRQSPPPATRAASPAVGSSASADAFDREQSLLERARSALVRHDAATAEGVLQDAAREFPRSRHSEERDYLWIQMLREKGDISGARIRARRFLDNYPDSLLKKRVEAILPSEASQP